MNQDERQALRDKYQAELKAMDAKAEKLEALERAKYNEQRNSFLATLGSLGDAAEAQWDEIGANLEKGWHGFRAFWHTGEDNESAESGNILDDIDDKKDHN